MKLLVDFDDVLFDTIKLKENIFRVLSERGIQNGIELYEEERKKEKPFSLKSFLYHVSADSLSEAEVNLLYEEIMSDCPHFLNEKLVATLKEIGKENCYIVTSGEEEFQRDKIMRTGLMTIIQEIAVVSGSKKEVVESFCARFSNEEILFIDDKNKFFSDINIEVCPNLKTIIYNHNGFINLKAEIEESKKEEQNNKLRYKNQIFPKIK